MEELKMPPIPPAGISIYQAFMDLKRGRQVNSNGYPLPLSNQEIAAWCNLTSTRFTQFELETVKLLDVIALNSWYTNNKKES